MNNLPEKKQNLWVNGLIAFLLLMGVLVYLVNTHAIHSFGFPLDDAWIHQTYARNLAQYGEWAFIHGITSGGSTAPLWTLLLVPGYLIKDFYLPWTIGVGVINLLLTGLICVKIAGSLFENNTLAKLLAGGLVVLEWHFLWAAMSGMETIFYILLLAVMFWELVRKEQKRWIIIGVLLGLMVWIRPDGITAIGPCLWVMLFEEKSKEKFFKNLLRFILPAALFLMAYLIFNMVISGSIWPATFYAKQAEYASMLQIPLLSRVGSIFLLPLTGAGVLLLPGFLNAAWIGFRDRKNHSQYLGWFLWWFGFNLIYIMRLPVTYQHGRYQIPSIFIFILVGVLGSLEFIHHFQDKTKRARMFQAAWIMSLVIVLVFFVFLGARQYGMDVAIIQTEMVRTAEWLTENVEPGTLIAVHDIGAIGYFAKLPMLDLAGLISPDVIPFIRDESKLAEYITEQNAEYLITFPNWYPALVQHAELVFDTEGEFADVEGGQNMQVFRWRIEE